MTDDNKTNDLAVRDERGRLARGNRMGRPAGSSLIERFRQLVGADDWAAIVTKAKELAKAGDKDARDFIADRYLPRPRPQPQRAAVVGMREAAGLAAKMETVLAAGARGELAPEECSAWLRALSDAARILESSETEQRLRELERRLGLTKPGDALDAVVTEELV